MELIDFLLIPIFLTFIYFFAFYFKSRLKNPRIKKIFIKALTLKVIGAISVGLIFYYYYGKGSPYGDTFKYHLGGVIYADHIKKEPFNVFKYLSMGRREGVALINQTSPIKFYSGDQEFFIIKMVAFLSFFSFSSYYVMSLFFCLISFTGLISLYHVILKIFPQAPFSLAIGLFFIPSVFFWGSGLLKDSITLAGLGFFIYGFYSLFIERNLRVKYFLTLIIGFSFLFYIKAYIILSLLPFLLFYLFLYYNHKVKNSFLRVLSKPLFVSFALLSIYWGLENLSTISPDLEIENLSNKAQYQAHHLRLQTLKEEGSLYNVGEYDGSFESFLSVAPLAVLTTIYRPFLWESKNIVMLLSALESTFFVLLTFSTIYKAGFFQFFIIIFRNPFVLFSIGFSIVFSIGIGITSGNFGTLVRYKIPMIPLFVTSMYAIQFLSLKKQIPKP